MPMRLRRWSHRWWPWRHTGRVRRRHDGVYAASRESRRRRNLTYSLLMLNSVLHPLMLRVQAVLYDIAESCDFRFPDDDTLRQVERRLIQLGLQ